VAARKTEWNAKTVFEIPYGMVSMCGRVGGKPTALTKLRPSPAG